MCKKDFLCAFVISTLSNSQLQVILVKLDWQTDEENYQSYVQRKEKKGMKDIIMKP